MWFIFFSIAYTALNDHESALECYRKALELDPTNQSYQNNLEIAEQKLKEEAAKVFLSVQNHKYYKVTPSIDVLHSNL